MVGPDGFAQQLGQQIIHDGERHRREPQQEEAVGEPRGDNRLHCAAHRPEKQHRLGRSPEPGERKQRDQQPPLRDVEPRRGTVAQCADHPRSGQRVGHQQQRHDLMRHLQPWHRSGPAGEDAEDAKLHPQVPKSTGNDEQPAAGQRRAGQTGHEPERDRETGVHSPAVGEGIERGGMDAAIGEKLAVGEKAGRVQLDRRDERQYGAGKQPEDAAGQQEQHRPAHGRVGRAGLGDGGGGRKLLLVGAHFAAVPDFSSSTVSSTARLRGSRTTPLPWSTQL